MTQGELGEGVRGSEIQKSEKPHMENGCSSNVATINHTSLAVLSMLPIDAVPGSNAINHIMVTSEKRVSIPRG